MVVDVRLGKFFEVNYEYQSNNKNFKIADQI